MKMSLSKLETKVRIKLLKIWVGNFFSFCFAQYFVADCLAYDLCVVYCHLCLPCSSPSAPATQLRGFPNGQEQRKLLLIFFLMYS